VIPRCTGPSPASQYSPRPVTSGQRQRTVALVFSVPFFLRCAGGCASVFAAQGGFGTCYEVKEVSTGDVLAVKIAPKKQLDVSKSKRRHLQDEIQIHSSLSVRPALASLRALWPPLEPNASSRVQHSHVVQCIRVFEDMANLYILLEYCPNRVRTPRPCFFLALTAVRTFF